MNKQLIGIALFVLFLFASVGVVAADKPTPGATTHGNSGTPHATPLSGKGGQRHGLFGTITAMGANSFTVSTKQGSVVVTVSVDTKFHIPTKHDGTFADLAVGDRVAVNGTPNGTGLNAKQVALVPGKPSIQHRVGKVTAYAPGSSITIEDVQGGSESFALTGQTTIRNPEGTGVAVGDRVTIVSRRDPSTDTFTASAIVVHPQ